MQKVILITGASRRLGLYLTQQFLLDGWQVHALTRQRSTELAALQCDTLFIHELESYNERSVDLFVAQFRQNHSRLNAIINNASIYEKDDKFMAAGPEFYQQLMFIHMMLPALLVSNLIGELNEAEGQIISITDIYADNPNKDFSLYCSTKAGLQNLTIGFAKKFAPNIRANCIQPGPIKFLEEHDQTHQDKVLNETLLAREGGFLPVYKTVKFIIDNTYITGECIKVDGGRSLVRG